LDFVGKKINDDILYDPAVARKKKEYWNKIANGKTVNMPIIVPNNGKSWAQCKLIFGNTIANALEQANEKHITTEDMMIFLLNDAKRDIPNGVPVDEHFLKAFLYLISPTFNDDGEPITLSKMDKSQASRLFKVTQTFLARMEIKIDDPPELETK
jgi:hypothetical protein